MFSEREILAKLQNGENVDDIAHALIETLNKANAKYEEQKERDEKAKAAKLKLQKQKEKDFSDIVDQLFNFMEVYYPSIKQGLHEVRDTVPIKDILKDIDDNFIALAGISDSLDILIGKPVAKPAAKADKIDTDTILKEFLERNKW